jgi:hypothetical protein
MEFRSRIIGKNSQLKRSLLFVGGSQKWRPRKRISQRAHQNLGRGEWMGEEERLLWSKRDLVFGCEFERKTCCGHGRWRHKDFEFFILNVCYDIFKLIKAFQLTFSNILKIIKRLLNF